MSGGVDSSVAASLAIETGRPVIGVTARMTTEHSRCCSEEDTSRAARVCEQLGIAHHVIDVREAFARRVVDYFADSYIAGRTPSPCVVCNRAIKFGALLDGVRALGASVLATGHYARRSIAPDGRPELRRGADPVKDQSYFLARLTPDQLAAAAFPLGDLHKSHVLAMAATRGLVGRAGRESQELCFVTSGTSGDWIDLRRLDAPPGGDFVDAAGRVLGRHSGIHHYTVGQRKGLGIALGYPAFVTAIDPSTNRVVVGPRAAAMRGDMRVTEVAWLAEPPPAADFRCAVQIRYRHDAVACRVTELVSGTYDVVFDAPQFAVAPGQLAAFYDGARVLGAGWIVG